MTGSERNDIHQPWCPLQVLESTVELTRTLCTSQTLVSNSWANSSRNLCIAFHSLYNTRDAPASLRTKLLLLKRLRKIMHPNMKEKGILQPVGSNHRRHSRHKISTWGRRKDWNNRFLLTWQCQSSWKHEFSEAIWSRAENQKKESKRTASKEKILQFLADLQRGVTKWEDKRLIWDSEQEQTAGRKWADQEGVRVTILNMVNGGEEVLELV